MVKVMKNRCSLKKSFTGSEFFFITLMKFLVEFERKSNENNQIIPREKVPFKKQNSKKTDSS